MNNQNNLNDELALHRTKLANQRTYLAYMQVGFAIAAIAGTFKKKWIALFGVLMIIGSTIQYIVLNNMIQKKEFQSRLEFDYLPLIYIVLSLGTLYLQFYK